MKYTIDMHKKVRKFLHKHRGEYSNKIVEKLEFLALFHP